MKAEVSQAIALNYAAERFVETVTVRAIGNVETVGWFPNYTRQVWVEITIGSHKAIRRLELPEFAITEKYP